MGLNEELERAERLVKEVQPVLKLDYQYAKNSGLDVSDGIKAELRDLDVLRKNLHFVESGIEKGNYLDAYQTIKELDNDYRVRSDEMEVLQIHNEIRKRIMEGLAKYIEQEWSSKHRQITEKTARRKAKAILENEESLSHIPPKLKNTNITRQQVIDEAVKKGYLELMDSYNEEYFTLDVFKLEKEELNCIKDLKKELKAAVGNAEEHFQPRPQIYIEKQVLEQVEKLVARKLSGEAKETSGYFNYKKVGDRKLRIYSFENLDSEDKSRTTSIADKDKEYLRENSVEERIIGFHNHTGRTDSQHGQDAVDNMSSGLGQGDVPYMEDMNRGIELIAMPWEKPSPKEDIVWFAGMIKRDNNGYPQSAGKLPIHIIDSNDNIRDNDYDWVPKYNQAIKYSNISIYGPYWLYYLVKEGKLKLDILS